MCFYCYSSCTCSRGSKSVDLRSELTRSVANEEGATPPINCSKNLQKCKKLESRRKLAYKKMHTAT